ncbi:MAG: prepilin-type N-terminal cleavage/methylation domain-containing protein [Luminiphilus sp.]|nr:prepilin-type N-terminal cleavage/methylation domain-containing protein [Luminiphilus sp.]
MTKLSEGFTLVEVIVALGIFSLIMLATVSGYRTLGNTASTINHMTDRIDELRSVSSFLRDALENSVVGSASGGSDGFTFGGSANDAGPAAYIKVIKGSLEWRSKILFGEAYGGSYFLRLTQRANQLVLQWQEPRGLIEPGSWQDAPQRKILDNLQLFEVWTRKDSQSEWRKDDTDRNNDAPSHVKLVIKANDRYWPELIMVVQR